MSRFNPRPRKAAAASLLGGVALTFALSACSGNSPASGGTAAPSASSSARTGEGAAISSRYRDGQYEATGTYGSGPSSLGVSLTLRSNRITEVSVSTPATNQTSLGYQQRFAAAIPDAVIGRDIADLNVGKLAGASTCPDGFNDALDRIRAEAAA